MAYPGLAPNRANAIFTLTLIDGTDFQAMLNVNHPTYLIRAPRSAADVFLDYLVLGVRHIWGGLDHLLFVFGLLLLIAGPRRLLWTITAFTLGHSVTLALATLGVIQYPIDLIEVLIAISVFTLAVTLASKNQERLLWRSPGWLAAGFGLLHGMGFAGALLEIGLPSKNLLLALFSFKRRHRGWTDFIYCRFFASMAILEKTVKQAVWSGALGLHLPARLPRCLLDSRTVSYRFWIGAVRRKRAGAR